MRPLPARVFREPIFEPEYGRTTMNALVIFLAVCAILYFGQPILIPVLLAVLLSFIMAPAVRFLQKWRLPKSFAILSVVIVTFAILFGIAALVAGTLANLTGQLPQYESNLREKAHSIRLFTSGGSTVEKAAGVLKDLGAELQQPTAITPGSATIIKPIPVEVRPTGFSPLNPIMSVVEVVLPPITQLGIVILMVVLFLFNKEDLRTRLIRLAGTSDLNKTTEALDEASKRLSKFFVAQICVNGTAGVLVGIALFVIGIPGALLWGVLTFVLRFLPYIGPIMASVLPVIIAAAIGEGWQLAIITAVVLIIIETVIGQLVEPLFVGKMTGLSPVAFVASATFWTALWGPIGLILATPMTVGILVLGRNIDALNFLDVLLGSEPVLTPDRMFYQRLLASDAIEAAQLADDFVRDKKLENFISDVAVPSLMHANHDVARKTLTPEREISVVHTFSEVLDDLLPTENLSEDETAEIVLISPPGVLNFGACLAFSALLKLKNVHHRMLPQDAISPGKVFDLEKNGVKTLYLCYLIAPSIAKHNYVLRRLLIIAPAPIRTVALAWNQAENAVALQSPISVVTEPAANTALDQDLAKVA
jgi:predicted PurR-regulated permease PerM